MRLHGKQYRCLPILFLLLFGSGVATAKIPELQSGDCGKCHGFQVKRIAQADNPHATEIACLDCHPRHPPQEGETAVSCADCHDGHSHYRIGDCLHCHTDPHQPLAYLRDPLKPVRTECLSCHEEVGREMAASPSRHAEFFCNRCHESHKEIPACLDCHLPHLRTQGNRDCRLCHPAHQPLYIVPAGNVPASHCRACHRKEADRLDATNTTHGSIGCIHCHRGVHPAVAACRDCHRLPHEQGLHSRFRNCLECHGDAHHLINQR